MAAYDAREAAMPGLSGSAQAAALMASGFDVVVLCHPPDAAAGEIAGARIVASGPGWTLYRTTRG